MTTLNKRTSINGEVSPEPFETQGRLFDFDIDGAEVGVDGARLKPKHKEFLDSIVVRIGKATNQKLIIRIGGETDSLGESTGFDNTALSNRRAAVVQKFLESKLPKGVDVTFEVRAFGASKADAADGTEKDDLFFRAVDVALIAPGDPDPVKPKRRHGPLVFPKKGGDRPRPDFSFSCVREFEMARSTSFSVRLDSTILGAALTQILFAIRDETNRLEARYRFFGVNLSLVPEAEFSNTPTQLTPFTTTFPARVTEFDDFSFVLAADLRPPRITFAFLSPDGKTRRGHSDLDVGKQLSKFPPRIIIGTASMESTCGRGVRGAEKTGSGVPG